MKDKKTPFLQKLHAVADVAHLVLNFPSQVEIPKPPIDPAPAVCQRPVDSISPGMTESQKILDQMRENNEKIEEAGHFHGEQKERDIKRNFDALRDEKKFNTLQLESKNTKHKTMSSKNEMLSQIKKNASDITSKSELLKKKIETPKKDPPPGKKEMVAKKFLESKPTLPSKKEILSKKETFNTNKKDILGSKKVDTFRTNGKDITGKKPLENKTLDKPKAELKPKVETKPDKPKLK